MNKRNWSHYPTWLLTVSAIANHSVDGIWKGTVTFNRVKETLNTVYGRNLTRKQVENVLRYLNNEGIIFKKRGMLQDGRQVVYGLNPKKVVQETLTIIKVDSEKFYLDPVNIESSFGDKLRVFIDWESIVEELSESFKKLIRTWGRGATIVTKELTKFLL